MEVTQRCERDRTMATTTMIAGVPVEIGMDGFLIRPEQWSESVAPELARAVGIPELTDAHWRIIRLMRKEYADHGTGPELPELSRISGVPRRDLYRLFSGGPAKVAARIAGIPKPRGCI